MKFVKQAVLGLALLSMPMLSALAFAQGESVVGSNFIDGAATITSMVGGVTPVKNLTPAIAQRLIAETHPMDTNIIMMKYDGKMYMIHDKKMPDGKMLSEIAIGK